MKKKTIYALALIVTIMLGFLFLPKPEVVQQKVDQEATEVTTRKAIPTIKNRSQPTPKNTAIPPPRQQAFTPPAGRISITSVPTVTVSLLVIPTNLQSAYQTQAAKPRVTPTPPPTVQIVQQSTNGCGNLGPRGKCYCSRSCNPEGPPIFVKEGGCTPCTP